MPPLLLPELHLFSLLHCSPRTAPAFHGLSSSAVMPCFCRGGVAFGPRPFEPERGSAVGIVVEEGGAGAVRRLL
jgi:hypothetical protein